MFIIRLLRFLQGYVQFIVSGGFAERFLNLSAKAGIKVWDVSPRNDFEFDAKTLAKNYKRMRPLAKKSGVKMRLVKKMGAPFIVHRYRKRWGIAAAVALFAAMLFVMSGFIWSIEIENPGEISPELIREQLAEIGVKEGTWRGSINPKEASRQMMLLNDDIAWIALNIVGSTIYIEINPRTLPPDSIDEESIPSNVVAGYTGHIKYMEVYDGQKVLGVGDTVMKGEIIVSGITEDKWGNVTLKHARAVVKAWVNESIDISSPLDYTEKTYVGEPVIQKSIQIFGVNIPTSFNKTPDAYDETVIRDNLKVFGRALPFTRITRIQRRYEFIPMTISVEEARDKCMRELQALEEGRFGSDVIIDKNTVGTFENNAFVIHADYVLEKDIAVVREIFRQ